MEVTKRLKPSGSVSRIGEPRLPLWVISGSPAEARECLLLGDKRTYFAKKRTSALECPQLGAKRTLWAALGMSAFSHNRTMRPEGADHQWREVPPRELSVDLVGHTTRSALQVRVRSTESSISPSSVISHRRYVPLRRSAAPRIAISAR